MFVPQDHSNCGTTLFGGKGGGGGKGQAGGEKRDLRAKKGGKKGEGVNNFVPDCRSIVGLNWA